jgi:cell division septation protein DedD
VKPLSFLRKIVSTKKRQIKISTAAKNAAVKLASPKPQKKSLLSRLRGIFNIKRQSKSISAPVQKSSPDVKKTKNGWLVIAVIGAAGIAGVLAVANFTLIRDLPTKQLAESVKPEANSGSSGILDNKTAQERPELNFWRELTAQEEQKNVASGACQIQETDVPDSKRPTAHPPGGTVPEVPKSRAQPEKNHPAVQTPIQPASGPARYTVQVGAFSHPSIAQEWATKWKSRGYDVLPLKPVARPNIGIIYRLYLGNFSSEKEADELVKHLKTKEGISAIRLTLRN